MAISIKPGRWLLDCSRRKTRGAIALVGSGGTLPKQFETMLSRIAREEVGPAYLGKERGSMHAALRSMQGSYVLITSGRIMFVSDAKGLRAAMRSAGWSVPQHALSTAFPALFGSG